MTALAAEPRYTLKEAAALLSNPTKDGQYRHASSLGPAIEAYLSFKAERASPSTLRTYETYLARVAMWAPDKQLEDWTMPDMFQAIVDIAAPKSRNVARAAVRDFFKWAEAWGRIGVSQAHKLEEFRTFQPEPPSLFTDDEELALRQLQHIHDRALTAILFGTGIRNGEARRLQWRHVNLENNTLRVFGKGSKFRFVPIKHLASILAELSLLEGLQPDSYLWYTRRGQNQTVGGRRTRDSEASETAVNSWWRRCLDEAGVEYRNLHTTRHTYATKYLRAGGDIFRLSKLLGHSSVAVTERYYAWIVLGDIQEDADEVMARRGW